MTAPLVLDGPMNGDIFLAYVEQILVPTLSPGDKLGKATAQEGRNSRRKKRRTIGWFVHAATVKSHDGAV